MSAIILSAGTAQSEVKPEDQIVGLKEYDVPYIMRVSIDLGLTFELTPLLPFCSSHSYPFLALHHSFPPFPLCQIFERVSGTTLLSRMAE